LHEVKSAHNKSVSEVTAMQYDKTKKNKHRVQSSAPGQEVRERSPPLLKPKLLVFFTSRGSSKIALSLFSAFCKCRKSQKVKFPEPLL